MLRPRPFITLTLAEISLLFVFCFAIIFTRMQRNDAEFIASVQSELEFTKVKNRELLQLVDELKIYKKRYGELDMLSNVPPFCPKGEGNPFLRIVILGNDRFCVDGKIYDIAGLDHYYTNKQRSIEDEYGCRVVVYVKSAKGVSGEMFEEGYKQLGKLYYFRPIKSFQSKCP